MTIHRLGGALAAVWLLAVLGGCQPKVVVEAPTEPITINLNVDATLGDLLRAERIAYTVPAEIERRIGAIVTEADAE